jgi:hypothetical protein
MAKTVSIPSHIVTSGDDIYFYNLVYNTSLGSFARVDNNIVVSDITISEVKSILDVSTYALSGLCTTPSKNPYSYFKPNGSAPYSLGDYAGYNLYAKAPTYFASRPSTAEIDIVPVGANYKIETNTLLRRGEMLPIYSGDANGWTDLKVDFVLYETSGAFLGPLCTSTHITGVDVIQMRNSTQVDSSILLVPNETKKYRLFTYASYTNGLGGNPQHIEDTYLTTDISAYGIIPWSLQYKFTSWAVMEPLNGATQYSIKVWNDATGPRNVETFEGYFRTTYWYYESPDGYPTKSYSNGAAAGATLFPNASEGSGTTVTMIFDNPVTTKDTGHERNILVEYQETGGAWHTLFEHTY